MVKINEKEMFNVIGGATIGYSLINAITKAVQTVYSIGQSIGSSLRRVVNGKYCSL